MKTILVVANETLGSEATLERIKAETAGGDARVVLCVPRKNPTHGNIIYADAVFDAAQVRIDLARGVLRDMGVDAIGEVGDSDAYTATMDAVAEYAPDKIIISTFPAASSGWLRRDLIERITQSVRGTPVEHIEVDIASEGIPFNVTLVVANKTAGDDQLLDLLKSRSGENQLYIVVVPQEGGDGIHHRRARQRMAQLLDRARSQGLRIAGIVGDPDPYTATMNALELFKINDIIISTLPATRSGWMRADLVGRVKSASGKPVEHIETQAPVTAA